MNNARRKTLEDIRKTLEAVNIEEIKQKIADALSGIDLESAKGEIEAVRDEEQEYKDNMPENMQQGEKGERADAAISALEEAISVLEDAAGKIEEIENGLNEFSIEDIVANIETACE